MIDVLSHLHDFIVTTIAVDLKNRRVEIVVGGWDITTNAACRTVLAFINVRRLEIPMNHPWGPSASINRAKQLAGDFEIEMQSGDVIKISAGDLTTQDELTIE